MNARRSHPPMDQWMRFVAADDGDASLVDHLAQCASCRALVQTLRGAARARRSGAWQEPPDELLDRALAARREPRLPRVYHRQAMDWHTHDVRGEGGASIADDAKILAGSCPAGEISLMVHPPIEDARWRFEARIWLSGPGDAAAAELALVHDDHVVFRASAHDGETVRFEEIVPEGWTLEIHMPGGQTVVLDDPFHGE